ncbi:MAG: MarR family winged helix-turn-helix transcriptional regulator [Roseiflexaceae bacterium]
MTQQTEHITTALLVLGPLYSGWIEQQLPAEYQGVKTRLLVILLHAPQQPMRAYAQMLGISKAHMTTLVDEYTRSGMMVRTPDVHDRRASQLSLSEVGQLHAQRIWAHYVAQTHALLAAIPPAQCDVFEEVCSQLNAQMHAMGCGSRRDACDAHGHEDAEC